MRIRSTWRNLLVAALCWAAVQSPIRAEFHFSEGFVYGIGRGSGPLALGDFDKDGDVDIAVGNTDFGSVSLFRNDGGGILGSPAHLLIGTSVVALAAGDLDNDGDLDLVAADDGMPMKSVVAILNNGAGSFEVGGRIAPFDANFSLRLHPRGLALGDFSGDGYPDAAVACETSELSNEGFAVIAVNAGNGSFSGAARLSVGPITLSGPKFLTTEDFTGDGWADLLVGNRTSELALFRKAGAGSIVPASSIVNVPSIPTSLIGGDLDSDGDKDLLLTTGAGGSAWAVFQGPPGGWTRSQSVSTGATRPGTPALADFDNDGDLDLAVTESVQIPSFGAPSVYLAENDGVGAFLPALTLQFEEFPAIPEWIESVDLDGDGDMEIVATDRILGRLAVYFNEIVPSKTSSADQDGDGALGFEDLLVLEKAWYRVTGP